jgi:S-adenosylmethionine decarboxylase
MAAHAAAPTRISVDPAKPAVRRRTPATVTPLPILEEHLPKKDYFIERDGEVFAGTHLLIDFWGATRLDDPDYIENALRKAVDAAGATLLHIHLHHFSPNGGVSGVAVLAESHISLHTWPERGFAAFDVFMCGACDPHRALPALKAAFSPGRVELQEERRGKVG